MASIARCQYTNQHNEIPNIEMIRSLGILAGRLVINNLLQSKRNVYRVIGS